MGTCRIRAVLTRYLSAKPQGFLCHPAKCRLGRSALRETQGCAKLFKVIPGISGNARRPKLLIYLQGPEQHGPFPRFFAEFLWLWALLWRFRTRVAASILASACAFPVSAARLRTSDGASLLFLILLLQITLLSLLLLLPYCYNYYYHYKYYGHCY